MKQLIYLAFMFVGIFCYAQNEWIEIADDYHGISFLSPLGAAKYDTLQTTFYAIKVDTSLSLHVHVFEDAKFGNGNEILTEALQDSEGDTLRAIAKIMLLTTNSELTSIEDIVTSYTSNLNINYVNGLEMSFYYKTLQSSQQYHTFIRYYLLNNRFYAFSLTTGESEILRAYTYKNQFFNSIQFNF